MNDSLSKIKNIDLNSGVAYDGYHIVAEQAVSLEKVYIVDLAVKACGGDISCAIAADNNCEVYKLGNTQFKQISVCSGHENSITNVRFSPESDNVLYSSSLDGKVKIWDLRSGECTKEFKDATLKPLTCMDVSCNDRVLCAGTELVDDDAYLLFWDIRSRKLLGGYWESHTDDITSLSFHPTESDTIASSSTDGLINLFDLRQANEDEALQTSLNTESSIARCKWNSSSLLSVITHTETVQLWNREGAGPETNWTREDVGAALSLSSDDCYVVNVHSCEDGELELLAGAHHSKGECLFMLPIKDGKINPGLPLVGNRQTIRVSEYLSQNDLIFTGGESGCLSVWKPGPDKLGNSLKKSVKGRNKQKHKPY